MGFSLGKQSQKASYEKNKQIKLITFNKKLITIHQ